MDSSEKGGDGNPIHHENSDRKVRVLINSTVGGLLPNLP